MGKLGSLFPDELKPGRAAGAKPAPSPAQGGAGKVAPAVPGERTFIQDLVPGQEVDGIFLVVEASLRAAKNGSKYIQAAFADRTGQIAIRHWDATEKDFEFYKAGGYIRARGRIETYQNRPQMIAFQVRAADAEQIRPSDFLPVSKRDPAEMAKEFEALLESVQDPDYRGLLQAIFGEAAVREAFCRAPAATNIHHAWIGGLLEHVLSAAKTAHEIALERPFLNRDLLLTGVILHDVGKIEEIDPGPGFGYTNSGRLCGHIALGALLIERSIVQRKDFPRAKRDLILHLILSHHGEREFGSPVTPCTAEAVALHHLECLDAKCQGIQSLIERENEMGNTGPWTDFARVVDGRIYKG
jgi:3'-5' exoribonuclease